MPDTSLKFKRGNSANFSSLIPHEDGTIYLLEDQGELYYDNSFGARKKIIDTKTLYYVIENEEEFSLTTFMTFDEGQLDIALLS